MSNEIQKLASKFAKQNKISIDKVEVAELSDKIILSAGEKIKVIKLAGCCKNCSCGGKCNCGKKKFASDSYEEKDEAGNLFFRFDAKDYDDDRAANIARNKKADELEDKGYKVKLKPAQSGVYTLTAKPPVHLRTAQVNLDEEEWIPSKDFDVDTDWFDSDNDFQVDNKEQMDDYRQWEGADSFSPKFYRESGDKVAWDASEIVTGGPVIAASFDENGKNLLILRDYESLQEGGRRADGKEWQYELQYKSLDKAFVPTSVNFQDIEMYSPDEAKDRLQALQSGKNLFDCFNLF